MSRRIQCNTLSVKPKSDGTCGNIECETIVCKKVICSDNPENNKTEKCIKIPYSFQVTHISLGMMGTSDSDCSHQIMYTPCAFKTTKITFIWHDWMPGYPVETLYYKIGDGKWEKTPLKESQTSIDFAKEYKENEKIVTCMYSNPVDVNEPSACIQSLSMNLVGVHEINLS